MQRGGRAVLAVGCAAAIAILAAAAGAILYLRTLALEQAEGNLRNLSRALAAETESTFVRAETLIGEVRAWIERKPGYAPGAVQAMLEVHGKGHPGLRSVAIFGTEGILRYHSSGPLPAERIDHADRPWFNALRDDPGRGIVVGEAMRSRIGDRWVIPLAMRLDGPGGRFAGVVMGALDAAFFGEVFEKLDLGPGAALTLQRRDSMILARQPHSDDLIGRTFPNGPIFLVMKTQSEGFVRAHSVIDDRDRLIAGRVLGRYPVYVSVSVPEEAVLRGWRVQAGIVAASATVLLGLLGGLIAFQMRLLQQVQARKLVERNLEEKIAALGSLTRSQEEQAAELARSNAELEQFAYVASHDLREPLRMVSNFLSLAERRLEGKLDGETREFIDFAIDGAKRMDRLILDLLQYSRIGRLSEPKRAVPVAEALGRALAILDSAIAECDAEIVMPSELPVVEASPEELVRLFQNLLGNALKYRSADQRPRIGIAVERLPGAAPPGRWRFAVTDNGIGISPNQCQAIFGIFKRLHTQGQYEGTGIGLAVCRKIVEGHGGRIWAESEGIGKGATFFFTLPAV